VERVLCADRVHLTLGIRIVSVSVIGAVPFRVRRRFFGNSVGSRAGRHDRLHAPVLRRLFAVPGIGCGYLVPIRLTSALRTSPASRRTATPFAVRVLLVHLFFVAVFVLGPYFFGLGPQERLPVGDRDLIVVGMYFTEGEETVAIASVFDEGGL